MDLNRQILHKATAISLTETAAAELNALLAKATDWQLLLREAELYAVANLLYKHIVEHDLKIGAEERISLKALSMRHSLVANARYKTIAEISQVFTDNGIPMLALKGLALAPMIYPEDRLRPMRDMDILVPQDKEQLAAELLRGIGFKLPKQQANKYMRDSHQLPNATKKVDGFTISVEVHHDALSRDVVGNLRYEDLVDKIQKVQWREISLSTLGHTDMLHQISRHLEGLHPGAVLKLINVLDVVQYAEQYIDEINWQEIKTDYAHVINTLRCLHLISPLSDRLQNEIGGVTNAQPSGIGEIMLPLSTIFNQRSSVKQKFTLLFKPSDWWLYLYYNSSPTNSLWVIKYIRHPLRVITWLWQRLYSRLMGG